MPADGDQHNNAPANPFNEIQPTISEYTVEQIATLQSRLQKQLGPEYISTRQGPGGKNVHYIASDKVIGLANEVFGFNGWSSAIRDIQVDFVDENTQTHKVDIGLSVIVRVTLRDGTYHEDIGYGHMEKCSGKATAFEKAKKEGTTDALKRTLRNFGNVLGNCVYDKEYLAKVTKIKVRPTRFGEEKLHRHADYAQVKGERADPVVEETQPGTNSPQSAQASHLVRTASDQQPTRRSSISANGTDEFGSADFDDADFSFAELDTPDGMVIDKAEPFHAPQYPTIQAQQAPPRPPGQQKNGQPQSIPATSRAPQPQQAQTEPRTSIHQLHTTHGNQTVQQSRPNALNSNAANSQHQNGHRGGQQPPIPAQNQRSSAANGVSDEQQPHIQRPQHVQLMPPQPPVQFPTEEPIPPGAPTGFLSAKAAAALGNGAPAPAQLPEFNPRAESPSIRKTAGVDHTKSMGVKRAHVLGSEPAGPPGAGRGLQSDQARRIGAPQSMASPLANRGQFKPVGKRTSDGALPQQHTSRQALNDVTAVSVNAPVPPQGPNAKRPRIDNEQANVPVMNYGK